MNEVPRRLENESVDAYVERVKASAILRGNVKALRPAHLYQLKNFEDPKGFQVLQFIEKIPKFQGSTEMITLNDGTTNEAVLEMLIDRSQALYDRFPSEETLSAINHMKAALDQLELRTIRRIARGVEGRPLA